MFIEPTPEVAVTVVGEANARQIVSATGQAPCHPKFKREVSAGATHILATLGTGTKVYIASQAEVVATIAADPNFTQHCQHLCQSKPQSSR